MHEDEAGFSPIGNNSDTNLAAQRSCMIVGPSQAGKTTLLLALHRASVATQEDNYKVDFVPDGETTARLIQLASEVLFRGRGVAASREVTQYPFRVFVRNQQGDGPEYTCRMTVTDGPGGVLLPTEVDSFNPITSGAWHDLVSSARQADSIALCVDADNPRPDILYAGLPQLILAIKGDRRRLHYTRVLLLITKVDRALDSFFENAAVSLAEQRNTRRVNPVLATQCERWRDAPADTSRRLAEGLDPIAMAQSLLGGVFDLFCGAMETNAEVAVGLCSAHGFDLRFETLPPADARARDNVEQFYRWRPFGVREALLFLAAGEIRGPVKKVVFDPRNRLVVTFT